MMNIFFLHYNPKKCAKYHVDRHVVKMILETCQLLCTAIWVCGGEAPLKKTHENHPSAIWARESKENWNWLRSLGIALCKEYTYRYDKKHKLEDTLYELSCPELPEKKFTEPRQAMPDKYKDESSITAYRNYYLYAKKHLHQFKTRHAWKKRRIPKFVLKKYPEYDREKAVKKVIVNAILEVSRGKRKVKIDKIVAKLKDPEIQQRLTTLLS